MNQVFMRRKSGQFAHGVYLGLVAGLALAEHRRCVDQARFCLEMISAALSETATLSSQGITDQVFQAAAAASTAMRTSSGPALWKVARTCP